MGSISDSGISVKRCARCNGSSCGQRSKQRVCVLNRAVQDCGRRLNQSHFRPMAEVSFLPSANRRKRASASREYLTKRLSSIKHFSNKRRLHLSFTIFLIVCTTKFSILIGSPRAHLSHNRRAIKWVSKYKYPVWTFCNWMPT